MSIRVKFLGIVAGLVVILGIGGIVVVRARLYGELRASLQARGVALTRDLVARSTGSILVDNRVSLYELVRDTLENNPDVRYIFVLGPDRQVLVHSFARQVPPDLLRVNQIQGRQLHQVQILASNEGRLTDVAVPILAGRLGTARVGLSHTLLERSVAAATRALGGVTAVALVLGFGVALVFTHVLTRPIVELVGVVREVSRGDLSAKAGRYADDESGELARAFNTMTATLARSREELLRRMRALETLNATATTISGSMRLTDLLQAALEKVLGVMELPVGWVLLEDGERLSLAASVGLPAGVSWSPGTPDGCPCLHMLQQARPIVAGSIRQGCPCLASSVPAAADLVSHACAPLIAHDRVLGILNVASRAPRNFLPEEINLLDSIGRQVGVGVENARLWEEVKHREVRRAQLLSQVISAQETERKRIARELHDGAGQLLTTLVLGLRTVEQARDVPDVTRGQVTDLKELAKRLLDEIHHLAVELRPHALDQLGLVRAIESSVREFSEWAGIKSDFEVSGLDGIHVPSEVETAVYRVVQEALANVRKHAAASRVGVLLERRNSSIVAVVEDDGCGFEVEAVLRATRASGDPRLGLFGMQERAELLNGRLMIESEPGRGTTLFVEIPTVEGHDSDPVG